MNLRELKNQLLSEIRRREEYSSKVQEIEDLEIDDTDEDIDAFESYSGIESEEVEEREIKVSVIDKTQIKKAEPASSEPVPKIESEEDADEDIDTFESVPGIESEAAVKQEIEPLQTIEARSQQGSPEVLSADSKINFAKDVKQILVNIVNPADAKSSLTTPDLRNPGSSSEYPSYLFDRMGVNVHSEKPVDKNVSVYSREPAQKRYRKETIPVKLKSKFGPLKIWSVRDKIKGDFLSRQSALKENIHSDKALYNIFMSKSK